MHIDPGRYVMASYPLLDNVTESLVIPYRSPPQLTLEPCPVIPQTRRPANPAGLRLTPWKCRHSLDQTKALMQLLEVN